MYYCFDWMLAFHQAPKHTAPSNPQAVMAGFMAEIQILITIYSLKTSFTHHPRQTQVTQQLSEISG